MADMPTIAELEARIASALGRIGQGLDRLPAGVSVAGTATGDMAALQEALEAERAAAAQLAERLRMIKEREATARAALEAQVAALTQARDQQQQELHRLRDALARTTDAAGRQDGNAALLDELEALHAARRRESAEMEAILSALVPLIEEPRAHA